MMLRCAALAIACLLPGQFAAAQVLRLALPARAIGGAVMPPEMNVAGEAEVVVEQTAAASAATPANEVKQKRLEKIRQLQFDRRPSSIMKAWLEPPIPELEEEPEEAKPDEAKAESKAKDATAEEKPATEQPADGAEAKSEEEKPGDEKKEEADKPEPSKDEVAAAEAKAKEEKEKAEKAKREQEEAKQRAREERKFDRDLKVFVRNVTLGKWGDVKSFLASLEEEEGREAYRRMLDVLRSGAAAGQPNLDPNQLQQLILNGADPATIQQMLSAGGQGPAAQLMERNAFSMQDVIGLIEASPIELEDEDFNRLGMILNVALSGGRDLEELLTGLGATDDPENQPKIPRRAVARLLFSAHQPERGGKFLPTLEAAREAEDAQALNLLAKYYLALHGKDDKQEQLEQAWNATQGALGVPPLPDEPKEKKQSEEKKPEEGAAPQNEKKEERKELSEEEKKAQAEAVKKKTEEEQKAKLARQKKRDALKKEKEEALRRAVELAPRVRETLGQAWLDESFTDEIERGREILGTIGTMTSTNMQSRPTDQEFRHKTLELQQTAVKSLLRSSPETAAEWKDVLSLLAAGWLREADVTKRFDTSRERQGWQRDRYGNYFFFDNEGDEMAMQVRNQNLAAIPVDDLLDVAPSEDWLALVSPDLRPRFDMTFAELRLKAGEEDRAFPYIEKLAKTHPKQAHALAEEFLRVWAKNHNPNEQRDRNPYMYYWNYEQRADRIPLTRSKQERNLKELAGWVARLKALPIEDVNETLVTTAFTTAHSKAEVYRIEAIQEVFGDMDQLKPRTLAELIQQMRGNLASVWQMPDVQKQNSTNRKQRDIQAEVLRGYEVAREVAKRGIEKHGEHWALVLAEAAVWHDENDYRQQLEKSSEYAPRREEALARFRRAAELYVEAVPGLKENEQTPLAFEQWFYASLGAVDLARISAEQVPNLKQPPLIKAAIESLPGETAEKHMAQFANDLFTGASNAKPELKFRYLRAGFEIVGDHKMAREAKKLLDYYGDLVSEIKLETRVDGSDEVGHDAPFGVFVNLVHTREIERESGGFAKYLQNQNQGGYYYYNFGRPLEDYRDKFQKTVTEALSEHFDVLSVTFQDPEVNSRALPEYGWRTTPYAYLLLKARGPEVDKIAPLRIDLDFLDTSGYAVLPVESPTLPIDAGAKNPPDRPVKEIVVTQTLDERQADKGKLVLEIRATAQGLVPALEELVDLKPAGFKVAEMDDGGVSVTRFDKESAENVVDSERLWTITLVAADSAEKLPTKFQFAEPKVPVKEKIYQRYQDADLVSVSREIDLEERYGEPSYAWLWATGGVLGLVAAGGVAGSLLYRSRRKPAAARFAMPETLTPFTVLGLLRDIENNNGLTPARKADLAQSIDRLEQHYFVEPISPEPDLKAIASQWLSETPGSRAG